MRKKPRLLAKEGLLLRFFLIYNNPETAEELSLELGIALPYMEDELAFLVREQLMRRSGNRYETNFHIVSRDEQRVQFEENKAVQKPLTDKICEMIDVYMKEDGSKVNAGYVGYENARWALLVRAFDKLQALSGVDNDNQAYPQRPDDGAWVVTGYESIDWKLPDFVGLHGWHSYDVNEVKEDIYYGQFKFNYMNIRDKTPLFLTYPEARTLWLVCSGRTDECEVRHLNKLLEYGYLKKEDGKLLPHVVVFDNRAKNPGADAPNGKLTSLKEEICSLFRRAPHIERGYVVEQALADGWLKYDDSTCRTIGAFIYLD